MGADASTVLCGVLGFPVAHSRSPSMHNAAFAALGLDWRYLRLPVRPERFADTAAALGGSGYRGANVTIPHKVAALALGDSATAAATGIGAANTLTFENGAIEADNTDAGGFLAALSEPPTGKRALVLGAGGAARAVVWALREEGAAEVRVWNRTHERAVRLATELGVEIAERPGPSDIIVNATSIGLDPALGEREALAALGVDRLDPAPVVVDLVYRRKAPTPVTSWAGRAGSRVVDGVEILVRQGALSLERWTGRRAPLEVMREAV